MTPPKRITKTGAGKARAKKSSLPSAEDLVEKSAHPKGPATAQADAALDRSRMLHEAEYKAKNRAAYLLSQDVQKEYSPSERFNLKDDPQDPFCYRWCSPAKRNRNGWGGWEPVRELDKGKDLNKHVHVTEKNGQVINADMVLCRMPREKAEKQRALYFQRTQKNMKLAASGKGPAYKTNPDGTTTSGETFDSVTARTASKDDPGVQFKGDLRIE